MKNNLSKIIAAIVLFSPVSIFAYATYVGSVNGLGVGYFGGTTSAVLVHREGSGPGDDGYSTTPNTSIPGEKINKTVKVHICYGTIDGDGDTICESPSTTVSLPPHWVAYIASGTWNSKTPPSAVPQP